MTTATATAELTEGIYVALNGDVIKLKRGKSSGHLYAQVAVEKGSLNRLNLLGEVVHFEYVYTPGLVKFVIPAMKMNAAQAEEFGLKFSACMFCGRTLKDAQSVAAGMGKTCASKFA